MLAIGTLLLVTLQQAFFATTRSAERVHAIADAMTRGVLHDEWLRQVMSGTVAETVAGKPGFAGEPDRIAARSSSPLFSGGSGQFEIALAPAGGDGVRRVTYTQESRTEDVGSVAPGDHFAYIDGAGQAFDRWPPSGNPLLRPPLPALVEIVSAEGRTMFAVALPRSALRRPEASPFGGALP